jgi:cytochrome c oxidase subunit 2
MRLSTTKLAGAIMLAVGLMTNRTAAADLPVHEIQIVAGKYAFEPPSIEVAAGEPVRLVIRSKDVVHGFAIPKLKVDVQIPKGGDPVVVEFIAPPADQFEIGCSMFCGTGHMQMKGTLVSVAAVMTTRQAKEPT